MLAMILHALSIDAIDMMIGHPWDSSQLSAATRFGHALLATDSRYPPCRSHHLRPEVDRWLHGLTLQCLASIMVVMQHHNI